MIGERRNLSGCRVLCRDRDGAVWAVPIEWTDQVAPSLEYELSAGRAYLLAGDAIALWKLLKRLEAVAEIPDV